MSGTSEFGYFVPTDPAIVCAANQPLDALSTRVLISNINHLSDEASQVRWNSDFGFTPLSYIGTSERWPVGPLPFFSAVFPVTLHQDGSPYLFRLRVNKGVLQFGDAPPPLRSCICKIIIGRPAGTGAVANASGSNVWLADPCVPPDYASGWFDGTVNGVASTTVSIGADQVQMTPLSTLTGASGTGTTVMVPMVQMTLYGEFAPGKVSDGSVVTYVSRVYCAEYVG